MSKIDKVATPFFSLFEHVAFKMYAGTEPVQLGKMKQDKPYFFVMCLIGDSLVRLLAVGSALVLAFWAALKVVI